MDNNGYMRDLEDIVEAIKRGKKLGYKINLLVGAGCSVTAGVPSAKELIRVIAKDYKQEYNRCRPKSYGECMARLTPVERRELIGDAVKNAKINWTHLGIAQLLKSGIVDRVLTTNFDNLIVRACSVVQEFPAIYDLTSSQNFRTDLMFDGSVIYLHGQYNGFILCNTKKEVKKQKKDIEHIFRELNRKSIWIIVGYSGENDAVSELLADQEVNENRLYWIGYKEEEPIKFVKEKILGEEKFSFLVKGFDSDTFFYRLINRLDCFPPEIIERPFSYLDSILSSIKEYQEVDAIEQKKINMHTKNIVNRAIDNLENNPVFMVEHYLNLGLIEKVINIINDNPQNKDEIFKKFSEYFTQVNNDYKKYIEENDNKENYRDVKILKNLIRCYRFLGIRQGKNKNKEVEYYLKAEKLCEKLNDITTDITNICNWVDILGNIGMLEIDNNIEYLHKAENIIKHNLESWKHNELTIKLINLYRYFNNMYLENKDFENAALYFEKVIQLISCEYKEDNNNQELIISWAEILLKNIDLDGKDAILKIDDIENKYKLAYDINKDITVKLSNLISIMKLFKSEINNKLLIEKLITKSNKLLEEIIEEVEGNDYVYDILRVFSQIEIDRYEVVYNTLIVSILKAIKAWIAKNKDEIDYETLNDLAYRFIDNNEFKISKELLEICSTDKNDDKLYLATWGMWHFRNNELLVDESKKKGISYYDKCIEELIKLDTEEEFVECVKEKKILEHAKICYYKERDILKTKEIIDTIDGKASDKRGYTDTYEEIVGLKEGLSRQEIAIE